MKYHFRVGRGKNIIINDTKTFEDLGFAILKEFRMFPDHLFMFEFENGEATNSATPLGPMNDYREVRIDMKMKDRHLDIGDVLTFIYDYSSDWSRKVTLVDIIHGEKKRNTQKKIAKTPDAGYMTKEELTQIREKLSLTKKAFAERIGTTAMLLGRYEKGNCAIPEKIAEAAKSLIEPGKKADTSVEEASEVVSVEEEDIPSLIRGVRESLSLSKAAFAKLVGVSGTAVGNYETGKSKPKNEVLQKIKEMVAKPTEEKKEEKAVEAVMPAAVVEENALTPAEEKGVVPTPIEEKKPAREKKSTATVIIQSTMGGSITTEEILSRLPDGVEKIYIKPEENAAYWVKGDESGSVKLW